MDRAALHHVSSGISSIPSIAAYSSASSMPITALSQIITASYSKSDGNTLLASHTVISSKKGKERSMQNANTAMLFS
jgi:hypothetical protein